MGLPGQQVHQRGFGRLKEVRRQALGNRALGPAPTKAPPGAGAQFSVQKRASCERLRVGGRPVNTIAQSVAQCAGNSHWYKSDPAQAVSPPPARFRFSRALKSPASERG